MLLHIHDIKMADGCPRARAFRRKVKVGRIGKTVTRLWNIRALRISFLCDSASQHAEQTGAQQPYASGAGNRGCIVGHCNRPVVETHFGRQGPTAHTAVGDEAEADGCTLFAEIRA